MSFEPFPLRPLTPSEVGYRPIRDHEGTAESLGNQSIPGHPIDYSQINPPDLNSSILPPPLGNPLPLDQNSGR